MYMYTLAFTLYVNTGLFYVVGALRCGHYIDGCVCVYSNYYVYKYMNGVMLLYLN